MKRIVMMLALVLISQSASAWDEYDDAQEALKKGDFKTAITNLEKVLKQDPHCRDCLDQIAYAYANVGEFAKASNAMSMYFQPARLQLSFSKGEDRIKVLREMLRRSTLQGTFDLYDYLRNSDKETLERMGRNADYGMHLGEQLFEAMGSGNVVSHSLLMELLNPLLTKGNYYFYSKRYDMAETNYSEILRHVENYYPANYMMARVHFEGKKDAKTASRYIDNALVDDNIELIGQDALVLGIQIHTKLGNQDKIDKYKKYAKDRGIGLPE